MCGLRRLWDLFLVYLVSLGLAHAVGRAAFYLLGVRTAFGIIRTVDLADLVLVLPVHVLANAALIVHVVRQGTEGRTLMILLCSYGFLLMGATMHAVANAIDTLALEVLRVEIEGGWAAVYALWHLLDEHVGHFLYFTSLYSLLLCYASLEREQVFEARERKVSVLAGAVGGALMGVAFVEAQGAIYGVPLTLASIVLRRRFVPDGRPMSLFTSAFFKAVLVALVAWYLCFGGFVQPSELYNRLIAGS